MDARELKAIRQRLRLTQEQLAEKVGVTTNSIARQERGELGIRESLARLLRLIAQGARIAEAPTHPGSRRRYSASQPAEGSRAAGAKNKNRRRTRENSVQGRRRAGLPKKSD